MDYSKLYIGGEWVEGASGEWIEVENPATMTKFARVPRGGAVDVDKAAKAAAAAQPAWSAIGLEARIEYMERFLKIFEAQEDELTEVVMQELGSPREFTRGSQVRYQYVRTRSYIDLAPTIKMVEKMAQSTTYRKPVGVIGCLTPWNYPLGQAIQKIVPALLMGNAVILKPSQQTPLSSFYLTKAIEEAGFPAGVFNLVTGRGGEVGDALATHPLVSMISFTGSTSGGVKVAQNALNTVKHISLELGGKSPCVVLPGAPYEKAVRACFNTIFLNSGQTCTALSRILVPAEAKEEIEEIMKRVLPEYVVGAPDAEGTKVGPVASKAQLTKISSYIERGVAEGAKILAQGEIPAGEGYYVPPTIFTDVDPKMDIAQEEIFGPVLCVISYESVDEAIEIANGVTYGLNAAVWGTKQDAIRTALRIESGNVYINDGPRDTAAPFGGWKQSGLGREGGTYGMIEFTQQIALFDCGN